MLTPAIILKSSMATCWTGLAPPTFSLFGLASALAVSSGIVLAGNDGFTSQLKDERMTPATGAMSRRNTKLSLS
jgi:hypothetical protein